MAQGKKTRHKDEKSAQGPAETPANMHTGGCHCGSVRFEAALDLAGGAMACNCSICQKTGTILSFIPAGQFKLLSGAAALTDYQFNKKVIHHLFCKVCGVRSFGRGTGPDGAEVVAVNVRCLDGVDLQAVPVQNVDGRGF